MDESYIQDSSTDKDKTMEVDGKIAPEKQPSPTKSNMEIDQEDSDNVTQRIGNLSGLNSTEKEKNLKPMNLNFDQDLATPNGKPKTTKPGKKSLCRHCNEPISAASRKSHEHKCALYLKLVEKTSHGSKPYKCLGLNCTMKYATRAIAYGHVSNKHLQELNQKDTAEESKENSSVKSETIQDPEPSNDNAVETGEDNELDQDEFENSINKMGTPGTSKKQLQEFRSCKYCSKKINIYGIYMHEKACQKKSMVETGDIMKKEQAKTAVIDDGNKISDSINIWPKKDYRNCQYCSKELHKFSLKRHEESCQKKHIPPENNENLAKNVDNSEAPQIEMTPSKRICEICNADYSKKGSKVKDYLQHIEKCKSLDNFTINTTTCKICKQDFPRGRGYLLGHIGKAHLNEIKDGDDTNNDNDDADSKQSETVPVSPKPTLPPSYTPPETTNMEVCNICNAEFNRPRSFHDHRIKCQRLDKFTTKGTCCKFCDTNCQLRSNLFLHLEKNHADEINKEFVKPTVAAENIKNINNGKSKNANVFDLCKYCKEERSVAKMASHEKSCAKCFNYLTDDFVCKICEKKFGSRLSAYGHITKAHKAEINGSISKTIPMAPNDDSMADEKDTDSSENMETHENDLDSGDFENNSENNTPSDKTKSSCQYCEEIYSTKYLNAHEQTCEKHFPFVNKINDERPYQCQLCSKKYATRKAAYGHITSNEEHMKLINKSDDDEEEQMEIDRDEDHFEQSAEDEKISNYNTSQNNSESEFSITDSPSARICEICHSRVNHRKYDDHIKSCKFVLSKSGFINIIAKKCEICDQDFGSIQELFHHVKQDHPAVEKSTPEYQKRNFKQENGRFRMPNEPEEILSDEPLERLVNNRAEQLRISNITSENLSSEDNVKVEADLLQKQMVKFELNPNVAMLQNQLPKICPLMVKKLIICPICKGKFFTEDHVILHLRSHHNLPPNFIQNHLGNRFDEMDLLVDLSI